tara:strand:- start:1137 stop:2081 length:945 start_codon:yes stop_codon:yes gene_type:complete
MRILNSLKFRLNKLNYFRKNLLNKFIFIENYTIDKYYGRFGNNLQQIAIGYLYAKKYDFNFFSKKHELIDRVEIINKPFSGLFKFFSKQDRFFNFHNSENDINNKMYIDLTSDKDYYLSNMHDIFKNQLSKKISFYDSTELDDETLVIHIRNGDIFSGKSKYKQYVQNPLVYYEKLIANYKKVIVVTESYGNNPVIEKLKDYSNVKIQSLSLEEDFRTLLSAKNLATSGVGTFGIAAALMSKNLNRLYCSDIFLSHHLNPYMLDPNYVKVHIYNIKNYIDIGQWNFDNKVSKIMMSKNIKIEGPKIMSQDEKNN